MPTTHAQLEQDYNKARRELTAANERIRELEAELDALKYSLQLDEELIGMIQKIITVLNNRPVPVALTEVVAIRKKDQG